MIRFLILVIGILMFDRAIAKETWFCTEEASQLSGNGDLKACGKGLGATEQIARQRAFHEAHMEFWKLCQASSTCKGYQVSIVPGRETCEEKKSPPTGYIEYTRWTCYRMLTFIVDRSKAPCDERGKDMFHGCPMNQRPD